MNAPLPQQCSGLAPSVASSISAQVVQSALARYVNGSQPPGSASAAPANPVPILRKTGAVISAGTVNGQVDAEGDRYAVGGADPDNCGGPCEQISVYTFVNTEAEQANLARNSTSADGHAMIEGHLFDIGVTGYQNDSGSWVFGSLSPQVIAKRVGGTVLSS